MTVKKVLKNFDIYLCAIILFVLLVIITAEIFSRIIFNQSIVWVEEISRVLFIWAILFGSAAGISRGEHIGIDTLYVRLKSTTQNKIQVVSFLVQFISILFLIVSGFFLLQKYGTNTLPVTVLPKWILYLAWPLSGLFMLGRLIEDAVNKFRHCYASNEDK